MRSRKLNIILIIALGIYIFTVLWYTVIHRSLQIQNAQFELFWSYKKWFAGDKDLGIEIMANVAMFVPFGFLLSAVLPRFPRFSCLPAGAESAEDRSTEKAGKAQSWVYVIIAAALFSLLIETLQFFLMRGLCEFDDVVSNVTGAAVGAGLYAVVKRWKLAQVIIGTVFTIFCIAVIITGRNDEGVKADMTSRMFCFQVDEASFSVSSDDLYNVDERGESGRNCGEIDITGFAFRYERQTVAPTIILRSTESGKKIKLSTEQFQRSDVNAYFLCEYDYTMSGFRAHGIVEKGEYEIMVQWPWMIPLPTGVFVNSDDIRYASEKDFKAPDIGAAPGLSEIVENGILRVYRPDYHCWVYQKDGSLYWIVDPDFNFEEDGKTYIQYQLWTTQVANLPAKRLEKNWLWDNIGGNFERYELEGEFGSYRVMKRELPTEYSITSIVTGYHKDGEWIWKNYFRPVYKIS
ncbi:hypothetical protein BXO88_09620 [Oribacterium sp. C9]|uniref:VanZ family protein n=1 Tax=Oribacterium sp. C9 TaxID=1943579 RepID=UPI0009C6B407|nr:VanZ family protein [Oribacterium sp. C9]OON86081.1 hypothetical protein BXO88_09620 [Oribacterium sp. C9]